MHTFEPALLNFRQVSSEKYPQIPRRQRLTHANNKDQDNGGSSFFNITSSAAAAAPEGAALFCPTAYRFPRVLK